MADLVVKPCRCSSWAMKRSCRCSSSVEHASVCSWNGSAVTSIRPALASSAKESTISLGRASSHFSAGIDDSTVHLNLASSGQDAVSSASRSAESR